MKKFRNTLIDAVVFVILLLVIFFTIRFMPNILDYFFETELAMAGGEVTVPIITEIILAFLTALMLKNTYNVNRMAREDRRKADEDRRNADKRYEALQKDTEKRHEALIAQMQQDREELRKDREESRAQHREFMEYLAERDKNTAPCNCRKTFRSSRRGR